MLEILVTSGPKGGNPGGRCYFGLGREDKSVYLKYCEISRLGTGDFLKVENQPIYEAILLEMAKKVGLNVPNNWVILNKDRSLVEFDYCLEEGEKIVKPLDSKRKTFFVSELEFSSLSENLNETRELLNSQAIYRDLLNIGDIVGKSQNYKVLAISGGTKLLYLDLGCGLVDSIGGELRLRKSLSRKLACLDEKTLKKIRKRLRNYEISGINGSKRVNLDRFGNDLPFFNLKVIDAEHPFKESCRVVKSLLSLGEIKRLQDIYFLVANNFLKKHKGDDRLLRV
ncbi:MAG: hypothetical protein KKF68_03425 [Nanoarchaeota archaeon]|nr:hypothetical protein [Nanoarchaeota archaeon]